MDWFYIHDGEEVGPINECDVGMMHSIGRIGSNTRVRNEIMDHTVPFHETRIGREVLGLGSEEDVRPTLLYYVPPAADLGAYASFAHRAVARLIDVMVLGLIVMIAIITAGDPERAEFWLTFDPAHPGYMFSVYAYTTLTALTCIYFTLFVGWFGATPGKIVCNLRVVRADGSRAGYIRSFIRYAVDWALLSLCLIPWFFTRYPEPIWPALCLTPALGSYALVMFTEDNKTIHDIACTTDVLKYKMR